MASQLLPPMSFWPTTKHKAPQSCKFTLGGCTAPLPIESQLLSLQGGSWSQRAATNRTVTLSPRVAVPWHPSRRQRGRAGWARMGAFPIFLLRSCPSFRRVARWAGRPGRWAPVIASACALLVRNESLISQIPRLLWPRGRGLGAPGCVSTSSSPRLSLLPLGRALGRTRSVFYTSRSATQTQLTQSFPTLFLSLSPSVRDEMFGNEYGNVGEAVFLAARTREGIVPP